MTEFEREQLARLQAIAYVAGNKRDGFTLADLQALFDEAYAAQAERRAPKPVTLGYPLGATSESWTKGGG